MIGPEYTSRVVQAVLGPYRSQLIPSRLWVGWLDAAGDLIEMSGTVVSQGAFGPATDGVTNTEPIDCGVAGDGWVIAAVGLFDAPTGDLVITASFPDPLTPDEDEPLIFAAGGLVFEVA